MSSIAPKNEARRRPVSVLALKLWEMAEALDERLDDPLLVLETLVNSAAKGEQALDTWDRLHEASVRFEKTTELAEAYEHVTHDKRIKVLPAEQQAFIFLQAARFFADRLANPEVAADYAERAMSAVPGHSEAFTELEKLLAASGKLERLSRHYLDPSHREADPERRLWLLTRAFSIASSIEAVDLIIESGQKLVRLSPENAEVREEVMRRLISTGRHKDVVELLEYALAREPPPDAEEAKLHREQLVDLCFTVLKSPDRALLHVEGLLRTDPGHEMARSVAEALLEDRQLMLRAASALSDAFEDTSELERAVEMLTFELRNVRGPRRMEVQRRLGILRQDALGDPAGALELLAPVVAGDPGDDALRKRFVELSLSLNQPAEAARLLGRALQSHRDPAVRARVGVDVGTVFLKSGDVKRAQAAFAKVLETDAEARASLEAARRLSELLSEGADQKPLVAVLATLVRLEPEKELRQAAARRLARLCDGEVPDLDRAILAYRALVGSPWTDEALRRLEALYTQAGDDIGLSDVLAFRADRASDKHEARELGVRALELRTSRTRDPEAAIQAYLSFSSSFGASRDVHARLMPLLEQTGRFTELAAVLSEEVELASEDEKKSLLLRLAQTRLAHLADPEGALVALSTALEIDPADRTTRAALERLLGVPELRLRAAEVLEPLYRQEEPAAGLLKVLEARAEGAPSVLERLSAAQEAVDLTEAHVRDPERALETAGRALADAVDAAPELLVHWLSQVERLGLSNPSRRARFLFLALAGHAVDSPELCALARAAGEAARADGDIPRAISALRQALEFDPSSQDVVRAIDDLLVQEGAPEERLALYESTLEKEHDPKRRRELLHAMARLQRKELGDAAGALVSLGRAVGEDPRDLVAHDALFDALMSASDFGGAAVELERMLPLFEGDRRSLALLRLAEAAERAGDVPASLARYRELLACAELSDDVLAKIEHLALEQRDGVTLRNVLEQRLLVATEPRKRVQLLERLGNAASWQLGDATSAASFWLEAARLAEGAASDPEHARRLYDRVLDADAKNHEAAARLVELCALGRDFTRLAEAFAVVLENADEREIAGTLLGLENSFLQGGAQREFVSLVDRALARGLDPQRARHLLLARARTLGTLADGAEEASKNFRNLLESARDDAAPELDAFTQFLRTTALTAAHKEDLRWLFGFRASRTADPVRALVEWAYAEEHELSDPDRAQALYGKVVGLDPDQTDAWSELARLQAARGDTQGALASLEALRDRVEQDGRPQIELRRAGLLLDSGTGARQALELVRSMLQVNPSDLEALRIVHRALSLPQTRAEAAELLEHAADAFDDPARRADVIEALLAVSADAPELADARSRWLGLLLQTKSDDPAGALKIALRGADAAPAALELWRAAEEMARKLQTPEPVLEVYGRALARPLAPEVADELGRQMVEFYAEWFDEPERVVDILKRVLELCPGAGWAFDRLKLEFNGQGRWPELFALYDRRLEGALERSERIEVLREAAMAARDFADDPERAIGYLEALNRETPRDARIEASLERLYERHAKKRPLIELLTARVSHEKGVEANQLRGRIAALWLDLAEAEPALELAEILYADPLRVDDAVNLLERLIALPEAREFAQTGTGKQAPLLRATARLQAHYTEKARLADVVRVLEIEENVATSLEERRRLLERIVKLRLEGLRDVPGALETVARLVLLDPTSKAYRKGLAELAESLGAQARRADVLVQAARSEVSPEVTTSLLNEAARLQQTLHDIPRALELYREVLARDDVPSDAELEAARAVSELLRDGGPAEERVAVLERLADLVDSPGARRAALGEAALLAFEALSDPPRAIAAYRKRLADDRTDLEAMHGLCHALEAAERWDELILALEARASVEPASDARRDRIRVAGIFAQVKGDRPLAIEAWRRVVTQHGPDAESFDALAQLISAEERWSELSELYASEVAREPETERLRSLWLELGAVYEQHTLEPVLALEAFVAGGDWGSAIRVAGAHNSDRETGLRVCERLYELSVEGWATLEDGTDSDPARAADWALAELTLRLLDASEFGAAVERLLAGARLPFVPQRRRDLRREAACLVSDRLGDSERAISLFQALLSEDPADEVATSSVTRLALLLEERGEFEKLVTLWENQASARTRSNDPAGAQVLWARAGELCEERLGDADRALAAYSSGAELGGEVCLEALARIYGREGDIARVATALERLCALSSADALGSRALALAEAQVTLGHPARARETLELALTRVVEGAPLRARLSELYRDARDFTALAALTEGEAHRATDLRARLELLKKAAELHLEERAAPGAAVPLLESALEIDPDDPGLRLRLAQALYAGARFEPAAGVLRDQLARYGARRPKDRALVHYELARVLLAMSERSPALSELDAASKIDPTHPKILQMLAKTAFEEGDLDRAERMYRSLLLVAGREGDHGAASRSEALYALSEVARSRGDAARADEFVASALETASENPREARVLEQALRSRGAPELLARVLELRLSQPLNPEDAVRALFELTQLHAGPLDDIERVREDLARRAALVEAEIDRISSQEDTAWAALGRLYAALGDREGEGRVLERRVEVSANSSRPPPDPDLLYRLARVRLSDPAEADGALDLIDRALGLDPDLDRAEALIRSAFPGGAPPRAALLLERIARAKGDVGALVAALERRIAVGDADIEALREGIRIADDVADPELATRLLEAALASGAVDAMPEHAAWLRIELAKQRRTSGDEISALALEEQAAGFLSHADATPLLLSVARGALAARDLERAQRVLEALRTEDPENLEIATPLLDLYRKTGQFSQLAELLDAVAPLVTTAEERTRLRLELSNIYLEHLDARSDAIRVLTELAHDVPQERSIRLTLAELLAAEGREDELAELLVHEIDASRDAGENEAVATLSLRLAGLFERANRPHEALEVCRAALELMPERRDLLELAVRLAKATEDPERLAEAYERLLFIEGGLAAGALCRRLVELRRSLGDPSGEERALELGCAACPGDIELCEQLMTRYRERGDLARVAELLDRAIAERPEDAVLSERLIETHRASGHPEQALAALDDFTRRRGAELGGYRFRAALLSELGRDAEAVADLERAAVSDPSALPELIEALERAMSHAPPSEQVPLALSLIDALEQSGDAAGARQRLEQLAVGSDLPPLLLARLAMLDEGAGAWEAAFTSYGRLAEIAEGAELDQAALAVARVAEQLGRPEQARSALERALAHGENPIEIRGALMRVLETMGAHRALARMLLDEALSLSKSPDRLQKLLRAGDLLLTEGEVDEAQRVLESVRTEAPENLEAAVLLARAYTRGGRIEEALIQLNTVLEQNRGKRIRALAAVYEEKANTHLEEGFLTDALGALAKAFEMDPKNARLGMRLGRLALESDEDELAQRALRAIAIMKTAEVDGPDGARTETKADANYALAVLSQRAGDARKAKVLVSKALSENPAHEAARALFSELDRR